jgi:hypothetical protein
MSMRARSVAMTPRRRFAAALVLFSIALACSGCELLADFDRDKIPQPAMDAATFGDASLPIDAGGNPGRDAGNGTDEDAGPPDEDAGR